MGLLASVHYGQRSRTVDAAFAQYVRLDEDVKTLRRQGHAAAEHLHDLEQVKAEVFRLRAAVPPSERALRLARASEQLDERRRRLERVDRPRFAGLFTQRGDHGQSIGALKEEFMKTYGSGPEVDEISAQYYENADRTIISAKGNAWKQILEAKTEWQFVPPARVKDYVSQAVMNWSRAYGIVAAAGAHAVMMQPSPEGETLLMDITDKRGTVHSIGFLATIEDYVPVCRAETFTGTPTQRDAWFSEWVARYRAPMP
jgi:hypothetical protein